MSKERIEAAITDLERARDSDCLLEYPQPETLELAIEGLRRMGEDDPSDGHHTLDELYHHRAALFAALCNSHKDKAWKSLLHSDGTMYEDSFIAGISTPDAGDISYHCDLVYWPLFFCRALERAPEWDGYTPDNVHYRLLSAKWDEKDTEIERLSVALRLAQVRAEDLEEELDSVRIQRGTQVEALTTERDHWKAEFMGMRARVGA